MPVTPQEFDPARGDRIKALRKRRQITQRELAKRADGVSERTVQEVERGRPMESRTLTAIATAFDTTEDYILEGGSDEPPPRPPSPIEVVTEGLGRIEAEIGELRERRADTRGMTVAEIVAQLRGNDEAVTLSSLREDVAALTEAVWGLWAQLQERGVLGEAAAPSGRSDESGEAGRAAGSS